MYFVSSLCLKSTIVSQAADLLRLPYLQPYVLNIQLNSCSPRRYVKQTRFAEPEAVTLHSDREKRRSFGYDWALNPSVSAAEMDSLCNSEGSHNSQRFNRKFSIDSIGEDSVSDKTVVTKSISSVKSPIFTPAKVSATIPRRAATPRIYTTISDHDLVS